MKIFSSVVLMLCSPFVAPGQTRQYSYLGDDPAAWTWQATQAREAAGTRSAYTTYAGDANEFRLARILTDDSGATYTVGNRVFHTRSVELADVFLTKLDPSGNVVFTASIGGKGNDEARALAVDATGNIYIAGSTSSSNFPLRNPIQTDVGRGTGFLVKLSPDGSRLIYSTYFGGTTGYALVNALAVDAGENVYLTGTTYSPDFPATASWPPAHLSFPLISGAFVAKIAPTGDKILYAGLIVGTAVACGGGSSCFMSSRNTAGVGIGVDAAGNAIIAGNTNTTDLPTTPGALRSQGIGAFVAKVNAGGSALTYLTYLGAANYILTPFANPGNIVNGLAVDSLGNAFLTGYTTDPAFPATPGSFQPSFSVQPVSPAYPPPPADAFVAKLNPDGEAMAWATFLGGDAAESGTSVALDRDGNVWIAGTAASNAFPKTTGGWPQSGDFVLELSPGGSALRYAARFPSGTAAQAISVDPAGMLHTSGSGGIVAAFDPGQPPSMRIFGLGNAAGGKLTGRVAPGELISIYGSGIGPATPAYLTLDAAGRVTTALAGAQVFFGDAAAPILYASDSQINAVVPFGVAKASTMRVSFGGSSTTEFPVYVVSTLPEIFKHPNGSVAAVNEDGSLNSPEHPARPGSVVAMWASGAGISGLEDGEVPTEAHNLYCCQVQVQYAQADVLYGGIAPGMVAGVAQVNFRVPATLFSNPAQVEVTLVSGTGNSAPATLYVQGP